jgi:hypothetical protein
LKMSVLNCNSPSSSSMLLGAGERAKFGTPVDAAGVLFGKRQLSHIGHLPINL